MENNQVMEHELDWNDPIERESDFVLLPAGEYDFVVEKFERGRSNGSEKLPPCNMAKLSIRVFSAMGSASTVINHNLVLHTKLEWKLSQFFKAIGQKKEGEKVQMNWNLVYGARGRCKLGVKEYNKKTYNEIVDFLEPATTSYQAQPQPQPTGYTPGQF